MAFMNSSVCEMRLTRLTLTTYFPIVIDKNGEHMPESMIESSIFCKKPFP